MTLILVKHCSTTFIRSHTTNKNFSLFYHLYTEPKKKLYSRDFNSITRQLGT